MSALRMAIIAPRGGSTSSYFATSLAYTLAAKKRVMLMDLDMSGGTLADILQLDDRNEGGAARGLSVSNLFTNVDETIALNELEKQCIPYPGRPTMRVLPGIRGGNGPKVSFYLKALEKTLTYVRDDYLIADLGEALAYPGLVTPNAEAEQITKTFQRVFVVMRDDPALIARTIEVLRAAKLSFAEIIICQQRNKKLRPAIEALLEKYTPELYVRGVWTWDEKRATQMGDSGRPISLKDSLLEDLGL